MASIGTPSGLVEIDRVFTDITTNGAYPDGRSFDILLSPQQFAEMQREGWGVRGIDYLTVHVAATHEHLIGAVRQGSTVYIRGQAWKVNDRYGITAYLVRVTNRRK